MSISYEMILFAAIGFALFGVGDLVVDLIWILRSAWRRVAIYSSHARATIASLPPRAGDGSLAIFIPTWDEILVINHMLKRSVAAWNDQDFRIFVGHYPNDQPTLVAINMVKDPRIIPCTVAHNGPTTKADCLNAIWQSMCEYERKAGQQFRGIVLHDAEDYVHQDEITLFERLIHRIDLIQIPVVPMVDSSSRWVAGHYIDEFAEAHGKAMIVREAIGASLPSAGVGTCVSRHAMQFLSDQNSGLPFAQESITEDYEFGLRLMSAGFRSAFVRLPTADGKDIIAVRAYFPATVSTSVRQKTRWVLGIALNGWDRMGWSSNPIENWMRLRDRRPIFSCFFILCGYIGVVALAIESVLGIGWPDTGVWVDKLIQLVSWLFIWRLLLRGVFVARVYGLAEGLRALPRVFISNIIAIMSAWRAILQYCAFVKGGRLDWSKTTHKFPETEG